jgi:excisionase family DNA binding protein
MNRGKDTDRATHSIDEAARIIGISRTAAFQAAHRGEIPVVRFGRRMLVPKQALARMMDNWSPKKPDQAGKQNGGGRAA